MKVQTQNTREFTIIITIALKVENLVTKSFSPSAHIEKKLQKLIRKDLFLNKLTLARNLGTRLISNMFLYCEQRRNIENEALQKILYYSIKKII